MAEFRKHAPEYKEWEAGQWQNRGRKVLIAGVITVPALATAAALLNLAVPLAGTAVMASVPAVALLFAGAFGITHFLKKYNEGGASAGRKYLQDNPVTPRDLWIKD